MSDKITLRHSVALKLIEHIKFSVVKRSKLDSFLNVCHCVRAGLIENVNLFPNRHCH